MKWRWYWFWCIVSWLVVSCGFLIWLWNGRVVVSWLWRCLVSLCDWILVMNVELVVGCWFWWWCCRCVVVCVISVGCVFFVFFWRWMGIGRYRLLCFWRDVWLGVVNGKWIWCIWVLMRLWLNCCDEKWFDWNLRLKLFVVNYWLRKN